ncbi:TRAF3-interacting JNK-activating modulator-like [Procambarus clarkii]|uniref:TRAF3-interacting JNK-activating modulator-like n=1 Tax=Procambarus clarkii TaxID=6728 RepID=UPI003741EE6C
MDLFASTWSRRLPVYAPPFPDREAVGVDAFRLKESWNANRNLGEHEDISGLGVTSKIHQEDDKVWKKEAEKLQKKLRAAEAGHKVILDKVLQESRLLAQQELETLQSQNSYENGKLNNRITLLQEKLSQAMSENLVLRQQSKHIQKMERECINYLSYNEALEKEVNFLRTQLQQAESQVHQERSSLQLLLKTHAEELAKNKEHHRKIAVRFLKNKLRRLDKGQ